MNRSSSHCRSFQAARIEREYEAISDAFNEYLAPYYPFNTRARAKSLSPAKLKQFQAVYAKNLTVGRANASARLETERVFGSREIYKRS